MTDTARRQSRQRIAVERIREAERFSLNVPGVGKVRIPRPEQLAYYGALTALAALEVIDWPIALAIGTGHALLQNHHSRVAQEIGEALESS